MPEDGDNILLNMEYSRHGIVRLKQRGSLMPPEKLI